MDEALTAEFAAIAKSSGCEILHAEFRGGLLRIVLDHHDGVTIDHCQTVSKQVSAFLDVVDWGREHYTLEVTSPGLDRELYSARDYQRFEGGVVKVTYHPPTGKRTVRGVLEEYVSAGGAGGAGGADTIHLRTDAELLAIPLSSIEKARLVPEFP